MLGLLAEFGIWPPVINASMISNNIKVLTVWNTSSCNSTLNFFCLAPQSCAAYLISEETRSHHVSRPSCPKP